MIHDQSASGNTLFIEPMSVVTLNNELKELEGKEQSEIEHILSILSEQASYGVDDLAHNQKTLVLLDFIFAKAKYAKDIDASKPIFREDGIINIKQGCHPLLDRKKVVPINVSLGKDFSMLIVTGPNTGGKTVSLKTVGLLSLMGQAGLHIPAFQGSSLGIFREIFADIQLKKYPVREFNSVINDLTNVIGTYEKLNHRNHKKDDEHLNKHAMHLIRLYLLCLDILEKEDIVTYRGDDLPLLMSIRKGDYQLEDGTYRPEFFEMVSDFEKRLNYAKQNTSLPETPDMKKVEEFVVSVNRRAIDA